MKIFYIIPFIISSNTLAETPFKWPNNAKAAISLAYDDALTSQLDLALPALNKHNLKATFYLTLSSHTIYSRLDDWRKAANQGHELGNHSITHACKKSLPERSWVQEHNDIDQKTFEEVVQEINNANSFLHAIDGESIRTFTVPCGDQIVENKNYVHALHEKFIGIKTHIGNIPKNMNELNIMDSPIINTTGKTAVELIAYVKEAALNGTIASFTFHGVGGDHLSVSTEAHDGLLNFIAQNKKIYWIDTYRNISAYIKKNTNKHF